MLKSSIERKPHRAVGLIVSAVLLTIGADVTFSQSCCGIGSSRSAGLHTTASKGHAFVGTSVVHSASGELYKGGKVIDDPTGRSSRRTDFLADVGYGVSDRFFMRLSTGFSNRSKEWSIYIDAVPPISENFTQDNWGLLDGSLSASFTLIPSTVISKKQLTLGAEVTLPWGSIDHVQDGVTLSRDLQAGSEMWALGGFIFFHRDWPDRKLAVSLMSRGVIPIANKQKNATGKTLELSATALAGPFRWLRVSLGPALKLSGADLANGVSNDRTGGTRIDIVSGLEISPSRNWAFTFDAELPAFHQFRGTQLSTAYVFKGGVGVWL